MQDRIRNDLDGTGFGGVFGLDNTASFTLRLYEYFTIEEENTTCFCFGEQSVQVYWVFDSKEKECNLLRL